MAPGALLDDHPTEAVLAGKFKNDEAPRSVFPDGIRTSGQHPPLYDVLRPYEDFPLEVRGPTLWAREDYENNPERWTHRFTEDELAELGDAADRFIASGTPLTGIAQVCYNYTGCFPRISAKPLAGFGLELRRSATYRKTSPSRT